MLNRDNAPLGDVEIWDNLVKYADKHNLVIDHYYDFKVDWMEKHLGACFCDWQSGRMCPCDNVMSDLKRFNNQCFCGLLCTKKRLEMKQKQRNNKKVYVVDKELNNKKARDNNELFKKIFKK